jgi:hypothetical protein
MVPHEYIKHFVQHTLGCGCPEEVFRSIDVRSAVRLNSFIDLNSILIIGNRLLVYIAEAGPAGCIEEHLPVLVAAGRKERDEKGLNRFRLVLAADDPGGLRQAAEKHFEGLRGTDEKVHLHVIDRKAMPFATKSTEDTEGNKMV